MCFATNHLQDTVTIDELNLQAWDIRSNNPEVSFSQAIKAIGLAHKISYQKGIANSYNILGYYYKLKGNYTQAQLYYIKSLYIRKLLGNPFDIAKSHRNIMGILKIQGHYAKAIETGKTALLLLNQTPAISNKSLLKEKAGLLINMGAIYAKMGMYTDALKNVLEGQQIFYLLNDQEGISTSEITIGNIYEDQKQYTKALKCFKKAIAINLVLNNQRELAKSYNNIGNIYYDLNQLNRAKEYYLKSIFIKKANHFEDDVMGTHLNLGIIYETQNKPSLALIHYKQCNKHAVLVKNIEIQYESSRAIGWLLFEQGQYQKAIAHLKTALTLSEVSGAKPELMLLYKGLAKAYTMTKNADSAIVYADKFDAINDSLNDVITRSLMLESSLKQKEQALLISQSQNDMRLTIIGSLSLILLLMVVIVYLAHRSGKSKRKLLELRNKLKEQELIELDGMILGQENERKRLSKELHDTIGSILSATKFAFKAMENSIEQLLDENKLQYKKINLMLDDALENVRRISHDMASGILVEKGLENTLLQLFEIFEHAGNLQISLDMTGFNNKKIAYDIELNLYRIIQELLTNVLKHAEAKNVSVQLLRSEETESITLMLLDDGKGFNVNEVKTKKGIGLENITQRIKSLSGELSIDSGKGSGTTITIKVPLNH